MRTRLAVSAAIALLVGSLVALADTTTTNFGWDKPTVNASANTWGTSIDANYDLLDATLGAVLTPTGNKLTPTQLSSTGNSISAPAWTTSGIRAVWKPATFTDLTSSGTVAAVYADAFRAATLAASSATTYTDAYGAYFSNPVAGTNVTLTNPWAAGADSLKVNGPLTVTGHDTFEGVTSTGATGTGPIVFGTSPVLTTPNIGTATVTSLTVPASAGVQLSGGNYVSKNELTGLGSGSTATVFTPTDLGSNGGTAGLGYIAFCGSAGPNDAYAIIGATGTQLFILSQNKTTQGVTFSISGTSIQVTNNNGGASNIGCVLSEFGFQNS